MGAVKRLATGGLEYCGFVVYEIAAHGADELHEHSSDYQISIPLIGLPEMQYKQQRRKIGSNQWMVVSPEDSHRHFASDRDVRMLLFFIQQDFLRSVWEEKMERKTDQIEFAPWGDGTTDGFRNFAKWVMQNSLTQPFDSLRSQELEWEVTMLLLNSQKGSHFPNWMEQRAILSVSHPLKRVIELIQDDIATDLSLDRLAKAANMSKFHLIRLFREQVGCTPSRYISQVRLERAQELLSKSKMQITDIAFEVGFGSLSSFERAYRAKYGTNAQTFRKRKEK